jgi:hypothetical protein
MSKEDPIRVFVTHTFMDHPDYHRVFEYLESSTNFFYKNCSDTTAVPIAGTKDSKKEALLAQIRAAEVVVVVSSMYSESRDWIAFQMDAAQAASLPIVALEPFGGKGRIAAEVQARAAEVVPWNERLIVDALRKHARGEDTKRWDVIEFDMS